MAHISHQIASEHLRVFAEEMTELQKGVEARFHGLSERELNWKPSEEKWSIAQCFEHLITSDRLYFPTFDAALHGTYTPTLWQKTPLVPNLIGRVLLNNLGRIPTRQLKAPALFEPSSSSISVAIFPQFLAHQTQLQKYVECAASLDTPRIIVASPVSPLAILSLYDALQVLVNHQYRHVRQAEQVRSAVNFGIV
jgi:hypothetical protein